jgi:hypothetical protein
MRIPAFRVKTLMIAVAIMAGMADLAVLRHRYQSRRSILVTRMVNQMALSMEAQRLDAILRGEPLPRYETRVELVVPPRPVRNDFGPEERQAMTARLSECRSLIDQEARLFDLYEYGCRYPWRSLPSPDKIVVFPKTTPTFADPKP